MFMTVVINLSDDCNSH